MILKALEKPLMNQLRAANLIVINKMDQVDAATLSETEKKIRELGIEAVIMAASATEGTNLDRVVDAMVS
jgi:G3E family GTPase